jgi:putative sugar O-methyltransferase
MAISVRDLKNHLSEYLRQSSILRTLEMSVTNVALGVTCPPPSDDRQLVQRLIAAFLRSNEASSYGADSQWRHIWKMQDAVVSAIIRGDVDAVHNALKHPHKSYLFYGFEDLGAWSVKAYADPGQRQAYADHCYSLLTRLAQAVGALQVPNPEAPERPVEAMDPSVLAEHVERTLHTTITPPEIYPFYYGLATSRGVLSERVLNALYCANRVRQLISTYANPRVLEIGAGLGRLAHYCYIMGIVDYWIVDVPLTSLAQGHFLARALGEAHILFDGEPGATEVRDCIKIVNPGRFFSEVRDPFDLIVNVDSLTELGKKLATDYFRRIAELGRCFLSVNHEVNEYRIRDLYKEVGGFAQCDRMPYWMRPGYVEEVFRV